MDPWTYLIPSGVDEIAVAGRPALTTPQNGRVIIDPRLVALWSASSGRTLAAITAWGLANGWSTAETACALACLVQAGLLQRNPTDRPASVDRRFKPEPAPLVSAVIVSYNSREWLPGCLLSLQAQTHANIEIIVVDNGSSDDSPDWLAETYSEVHLERLPAGMSLAAALNRGIRLARGEYFLVLNPDVELTPNAVEKMVTAAQSCRKCAAVAAKLRFLWAPAFLNGLGNFVGALAYGTDSGLGHLDLGQFDHWSEVSSACFAAALIPTAAFKAVGELDEGFPMYYEDSEWCYRARLMGYPVAAEPSAVVYHAFSGRVPGGEEHGLAAGKLRRVTYGRLRFITRLLDDGSLARFRRRYWLEDCIGGWRARLLRRGQAVQAYRQAWEDYHRDLPNLLNERASIQPLRTCSDTELFALQRGLPPPLIWRGLPLLTWDVIHAYYAEWILGEGRSRFPETAGLPQDERMPAYTPLKRAAAIWRIEGLPALLYRIAKGIQWKLMQP